MRTSLPWKITLSLFSRSQRHHYGPHAAQVADLHLPRRTRPPYPVAVLLHGGSWNTRFGKLVCRPLANDLTGRGWAVWNLEYRRLGPGPGGGGGWPTTLQDVRIGIDHLAGLDLGVARLLDRDVVVLVGHSAGGQLALWAAGSETSSGSGRRPAYGPRSVRVVAVLALSPVTHLDHAGQAARALLGGSRREVARRWAVADPVTAEPVPVPVLIVHPRGDQTVPVSTSRAYRDTSNRRGGKVTLMETPDRRHSDPIDPGSSSWRVAARWLEGFTTDAALARRPSGEVRDPGPP